MVPVPLPPPKGCHIPRKGFGLRSSLCMESLEFCGLQQEESWVTLKAPKLMGRSAPPNQGCLSGTPRMMRLEGSTQGPPI